MNSELPLDGIGAFNFDPKLFPNANEGVSAYVDRMKQEVYEGSPLKQSLLDMYTTMRRTHFLGKKCIKDMMPPAEQEMFTPESLTFAQEIYRDYGQKADEMDVDLALVLPLRLEREFNNQFIIPVLNKAKRNLRATFKEQQQAYLEQLPKTYQTYIRRTWLGTQGLERSEHCQRWVRFDSDRRQLALKHIADFEKDENPLMVGAQYLHTIAETFITELYPSERPGVDQGILQTVDWMLNSSYVASPSDALQW